MSGSASKTASLGMFRSAACPSQSPQPQPNGLPRTPSRENRHLPLPRSLCRCFSHQVAFHALRSKAPVLQGLLHVGKKPLGVGAVDDAMIVCERKVGHVADGYVVVSFG